MLAISLNQSEAIGGHSIGVSSRGSNRSQVNLYVILIMKCQKGSITIRINRRIKYGAYINEGNTMKSFYKTVDQSED